VTDSIRSRVAVLVFAIAVPLTGVLLWGFIEEINRQHAEARDLALRIARSIAADVRDSNTRERALLLRMAGRAKIQAANAADCDSIFAIVEFFPQYPNLILFDLGGTALCSAADAPLDRPYTSVTVPVIARAIRGRNWSSHNPIIVRAKDRWIIVAFQPVTSGGRAVAVLALMQYLDLDTDAYQPETVITMVDRQRRIVARSHEAEKWIGKTGNATTATRAATGGDEGRLESVGIDGVSRQYGFKRVAGLPWTVFVGIPNSSAMAPFRSFLFRGIAIGLIVIAVVAAMAIRFTRTIEQPLAVLARTVKRAADPTINENVPIEGPQEIQTVGRAFNEMVRSRAAAEHALLGSTAQLEALSEKLLEVQEEERGRIAREIHDELGQLLTALNMDIGGLLSSTNMSVAQGAMAKRIRQALAETMSSVQRIASELRPAILDDFGLIAAIELELEKFEQRTGIECDLSVAPELPPMGNEIDAAIFRIIQEATTNVARHANATRIEVRFRFRDHEVLVEVRDDGRGIRRDVFHERASIGLIGMRERARGIGGRLDVEGVDGHGTIVSLRLPLPTGEEVAKT
jgi:signal transduction histidine kinase